MKNIHIVLPSWLYNQQRWEQAQHGFWSLIKTRIDGHRPVLWLLLREMWHLNLDGIDDVFDVKIIRDPEAKGTERPLAYGSQVAFENGADYVTWLGDDLQVNPVWLLELDALIDRHPQALAWSVYRSAYESTHLPIEETEQDVMVRSLCGHGLTVSKVEWEAWGINWRNGGQEWWLSPWGSTLDLHHAFNRTGERWCTKNSYINHTGKVGKNCTEDIPEYALNFVS